MRLIGLAGRAGVGKDTAADFLCEVHGFVKIGLADPLRRGIEAMFGLSAESFAWRDLKERRIPWIGKSPRQLLQTLGTEWGRDQIAPDIWLRVARRRIEEIAQMDDQHVAGIVVSDIRFENEADWIRSLGGNVWHIRRHEVLRPGVVGGSAWRHASEQQFDFAPRG